MTCKMNTVEAEYAKDPKIKREDIIELMNWARQIENMPKVSEYMLIQFYQVSDYDVEKAKHLTDLCYTFKAGAMELFTGADFDSTKYKYTFWDVNYFSVLPETTAEGYRILYAGLKDFSASKYDFVTMVTVSMKIVLSGIFEKGVCPGYVIVFDVRGFGIGHLLTMHISFIRKFFYFLQEAAPVKVRAIHVIHLHSIFDKMMKLMSPFMKKELYDAITTYPNMEEFFKVVRKEAIPKDLEGEYPKTRDEISEETRQKVAEFDVEIMDELQKHKEVVKCQRSFFQNWKFF